MTTKHTALAVYAVPIMQTYVEQLLTRIGQSAGERCWMHLDEKGMVRVGAGLLLADVDAAETLPFQLGFRAATRGEIAAEFHRVKALPPRLPAAFYRSQQGPELEPEMIDALLRTSLVGLQGQLRASVPGFDELGIGTKMALLNMSYKAGAAAALSQYPCIIGPQAARTPQAAISAPRPPGVKAGVQSPIRRRETFLQNLGFGLVGMGVSALEWLQTIS